MEIFRRDSIKIVLEIRGVKPQTACLPGEAIRPGRASFKEAGCLKPGARQMGGQERGKHEDTCGM